ncbi:MAG: cytidine deaminase [Saprospiraceae bacterium]|nr:cytidine deaminase [Saprospiraceae bacterium]MCB9318739.1 cytidine deaminase [Lewinellaceae bacterium]
MKCIDFGCKNIHFAFYSLFSKPQALRLKEKTLQYQYTLISDPDELSREERDLLGQAWKATETSYSPYSHFAVGAAVLLKNGEVISGSNQENASFPVGSCAERVAVHFAKARYPHESIELIAIRAKKADHPILQPVTPCGACRQLLIEVEHQQKKTIKLLLQGEAGPVMRIESVQILLPFYFSGDVLLS